MHEHGYTGHIDAAHQGHYVSHPETHPVGIERVTARQILDSRGYPTVSVTLHLHDGTQVSASAPAGAGSIRRPSIPRIGVRARSSCWRAAETAKGAGAGAGAPAAGAAYDRVDATSRGETAAANPAAITRGIVARSATAVTGREERDT